MAIGDLSELLIDSKYQTVVDNFIKGDRFLVAKGDDMFNSLATDGSNNWQGQVVPVPDLTDTDQSNDESFDDEDEDDSDDYSKINRDFDRTTGMQHMETKMTETSGELSTSSPELSGISLQSEDVSDSVEKLMINDNNVERQVIMKIIIRIVSNLLITKFPMDECCNNRNNLIINNLISFLEKVLSRSRISLNQFLVSILYLFRILKNLNGKPEEEKTKFKNNGDKLCLRRLIVTSLVASSKHYNENTLLTLNVDKKAPSSYASSSRKVEFKVTKNSNPHYKPVDPSQSIKQRILNQNLNVQVWSMISGLPASELIRLETNFSKFIAYNFTITPAELHKFKSELNLLIKLIIKSDGV